MDAPGWDGRFLYLSWLHVKAVGSTHEGGGQGSPILGEAGQAGHPNFWYDSTGPVCHLSRKQGHLSGGHGSGALGQYDQPICPGVLFSSSGALPACLWPRDTSTSCLLPPPMEEPAALPKRACSPISSQEKNQKSSMRLWLTSLATYEPSAQISSIDRWPPTLTYVNTPLHALTHSHGH